MPLATLAAVAAGGVYLVEHNPAEGGIYPRCPLHAVTGWWCPGCGLTRATYHLVTGNVRAALGSNLFLPIVIVAAVTGWWTWWRRSRSLPAPRWPGRIPGAVWAGLAITFVAFGVLRNLPGFEALAP